MFPLFATKPDQQELLIYPEYRNAKPVIQPKANLAGCNPCIDGMRRENQRQMTATYQLIAVPRQRLLISTPACCILLAGTLSAGLKGDVAKGLLGKTARCSLDSTDETAQIILRTPLCGKSSDALCCRIFLLPVRTPVSLLTISACDY